MTTSTNDPPGSYLDPKLLASICKEVIFAPGDMLRVAGLLSVDMYLIARGEVEIHFGNSSRSGRVLTASRGSPIGEIGFLTGVPATATVTAKTEVGALYIDRAAWQSFEQQAPPTAVAFYRELCKISEGRRSYNLVNTECQTAEERDAPSEIVLCRHPDQLLEAQRIRYQVYCEELGRSSPYADPFMRTIADDLDATGHVLLAVDNGRPVATMRMNMSRDGGLGVLEELYCMSQCPTHPQNTGIVTKFIVGREHRFGQNAFKLMATAIEMARRYDIKDCFMDCVPQLKPFFMALGFAQAGPPFLHYENGRSYPLRLDVDRYFNRVMRLAGIKTGTASHSR